MHYRENDRVELRHVALLREKKIIESVNRVLWSFEKSDYPLRRTFSVCFVTEKARSTQPLGLRLVVTQCVKSAWISITCACEYYGDFFFPLFLPLVLLLFFLCILSGVCPKGGRGCPMSLPCLESQGCHLVPLYYLLSCSSAESC